MTHGRRPIIETRRFEFRRGIVDPARSTITCEYRAHTADGSTTTYRDVIRFPAVTAAAWAALPPPTLDGFCVALTLVHGINFWKLHCAPEIELADFELTVDQAAFWTTVYTKGLGEFFYRARIDFRGLVKFPSVDRPAIPPPVMPRAPRALVAQGGGKDSLVTADALERRGVPWVSLVVGRTNLQERVTRALGKPVIRVVRQRDPVLLALRAANEVVAGYPSVVTDMLVGVLAGLLHDYAYVIFSNEQSAESPNLEYLGLAVNHQWSKSIECELLLRRYLSDHVTTDVVPFSLLHPYTEVFMVREVTKLPRYLPVFSSCNTNHLLRYDPATIEAPRAHWCNRCPKCVFIYTCMSAFIPRAQLLDLFGADLHADASLVPLYRRLLGLEGNKPFECVGTPNEMIVALARARATGDYAGTPAMELLAPITARADLAAIEREVFAHHGGDTTPADFAARFLTGPLFDA